MQMSLVDRRGMSRERERERRAQQEQQHNDNDDENGSMHNKIAL